MLLSRNSYIVLNKRLLKKIGINASIILSELINYEETSKINKDSFFITKISKIQLESSLHPTKIKQGINKLYKNKLIEIFVKNEEEMRVKILHNNISSLTNVNQQCNTNESQNTIQKSFKKTKKFKKPSLHELKNYFLSLNNEDESEIMYDFYESKGWKIGKNNMKCWKSAARNWIRRAIKINKIFPDYYDSQIEKTLNNNPTELKKYHNHLKNLGWISTYSPSSGTTWKKVK
ncbi:MAG: hypothetical protein CMP65_01975 [Flavobacteriales bacterium]|nr:hypothetical protein [Flavobacteriales bacterium]